MSSTVKQSRKSTANTIFLIDRTVVSVRSRAKTNIEHLASSCLEHILSYLDFDTFVSNLHCPSFVCHTFCNATLKAQVVVRIRYDNVNRLHLLVHRIPSVVSLDVDCLDETVLLAIKGVTGLRSLQWRAPKASCFDALPEILQHNSRLAVLRGSREFFTGLEPGQGGVVYKIERLLAERPYAQINDTLAMQCKCGYVRFSKTCPIPHCVSSFVSPTLPHDMQAHPEPSTFDQDLIDLRRILSNPSDLRLHNNANFWYGLSERYIKRLEVQMVKEEASEQQVLLLRRDIQAATIRMRDMKDQELILRAKLSGYKEDKLYRIELRGALAVEQEKNQQLQIKCSFLQQQLQECKQELLASHLTQEDQERKLNAPDIHSLNIDELKLELAATKATCRYLEEERRRQLLKKT